MLRIKCRDGDLERLTLAAAIFPEFALLLRERIGLKPQARSGEIKRRLFITPILFLPDRDRYQLSTVNCQLKILISLLVGFQNSPWGRENPAKNPYRATI